MTKFDIRERIGLIGIRERIGLFVIACFVTVLLWHMFFYLPKKGELKTIKEEIKMFQGQYNLLSNDASIAAFKAANAGRISKRYNELIKKLPQKKDIASTLSQIAKIGQRENIRILSIEPLKFQLFKNRKSMKDSHLEEIPIDIIMKGKFVDIGRYLFDITNLPFFVGYKSIRMEMSEEICPDTKAKITCVLLFLRNGINGSAK